MLSRPSLWICLGMLIPLVLLMLLTGCSTPKRRAGATLTDAAEVASGKPEERERSTENRREPDREDDEDDTASSDDQPYVSGSNLVFAAQERGDATPNAVVSTVNILGAIIFVDSHGQPVVPSSPPPPSPPPEPPRQYRQNIIIGGYASDISASQLEIAWGVTLMYSRYEQSRLRWAFGGYYSQPEKGSAQLVQTSMSSLSEIGLEASVRWYVTADHTFMGLYGIGGLRVGSFSWTWQEPLTAETEDGGTETIENDSLWVGFPYLGLGISPVQTPWFHLGVNGTWGLRIYSSTSGEGFENNLFADARVFQLLIECSFFF